MTTRVIIVRHGQSSYNAQRRIQGRCDESILTDAGRAAARQVATALNGLTFDAVYTSPLQRAKETAQIITASLEPSPALEVTDQLLEIDLPLWETMLRQEVQEKFAQDYRCWQERSHEFRMLVPISATETKEHFPVLALFEQAQQFWQNLLARHSNGTILIIAHNGINRALISTALRIPAAFYHSIQQSNCGISVLNFSGQWGEPVQLESMNLTSHVGEVLPKPRPSHQGPRLLLVRHGETEWNRQGRFQGQIDVPLNDHGREQSRKTADFLQPVKIDAAVSSSMARPKETAEIILQHHPQIILNLDDGLREISHGLWEGKYEREIEQEYPGLLQQWKDAPETVQMPEGENLQQVWQRAIAAWKAIVSTYNGDGTVMVVAHDAINKAILCHLFGLGPESFWTFKQGNGAVSVIDYPLGADHLPVLQTMNITSQFGSVLDRTAAGAL